VEFAVLCHLDDGELDVDVLHLQLHPLQTMAADTSNQQHAALQAHLFPSFSALDIQANAKQRGRLNKTKMRAHKLRNRLHQWEDKLEEKTPFKGALGLPRAMPDMRFEQSYLATIRGFVHELRPEESTDEKRAVEQARGKDGAPSDLAEEITTTKPPKVVATLHRTPEPELWVGNLKVDWYPLFWVTFRDQVMSPLVQGTVWGLAGLVLAQVRTLIFANRRIGRT